MTIKRGRTVLFVLTALAILGLPVCGRGQAALLMEEPYGFFGTINPTGHTAVYFSRLCVQTPAKLRRCEAGELGAVIARYQGISSYDWVAMPLLPYLYSVEDSSDVPERVNREKVTRMRRAYHEEHLAGLSANEGNLLHGGWDQLIGVSYERRIYAFRFATTEEQDDALMDELNDRENKSHFNLVYNNCADFARILMNSYFPGTFHRAFFPDAGMTTPRQIASKLVHYSKEHPEAEVSVFEISQVPGYRRRSGRNKSVSASLITTGYAIPLAVLNPYLAGAIFVDYIARGRYPVLPAHPVVLEPRQLSQLSGIEMPAPEPAASVAAPGGGASTVLRHGTGLPSQTPVAAPAMWTIMETHE